MKQYMRAASRLTAVAVMSMAALDLMAAEQPGNTPKYSDPPSLFAAAEGGDSDAAHALGVQYLYGEGRPKDYSYALMWLHKAAMQNHAEAQLSLSYMYVNGLGVPENWVDAAAWALVAKLNGSKNTMETLTKFKRSLTLEQWKRAKNRAGNLMTGIERAQKNARH